MRRKRKEKKEKRPGWSLFSACLHAAAAIKSKNGTCVCARASVWWSTTQRLAWPPWGGSSKDWSRSRGMGLETGCSQPQCYGYGRTSNPYLLLFQEKQLVGKSSFVPLSLNPVREKIQVKLEGERVLFIGTQFSILYTSMYSPAGADSLFRWGLQFRWSARRKSLWSNWPLLQHVYIMARRRRGWSQSLSWFIDIFLIFLMSVSHLTDIASHCIYMYYIRCVYTYM